MRPLAGSGNWTTLRGGVAHLRHPFPPLTMDAWTMCIACMASKRLITIRLDPEELRALARRRRQGRQAGGDL